MQVTNVIGSQWGKCRQSYGFEFNLELICTSDLFQNVEKLKSSSAGALETKNHFNGHKFAWKDQEKHSNTTSEAS